MTDYKVNVSPSDQVRLLRHWAKGPCSAGAADITPDVLNAADTIESLLTERDELRTELEALKARLPKTADGVAVSSCSTLWFVHPDVDGPMCIKGIVLDLWNLKAFATYQRAEYLTELHCYSTREAAEQAAKEDDQ